MAGAAAWPMVPTHRDQQLLDVRAQQPSDLRTAVSRATHDTDPLDRRSLETERLGQVRKLAIEAVGRVLVHY